MSFFSVKYKVSKDIVIDSDAKTIFDYLVNFDKKSKWSPWLILDRESAIIKQGTEGTKGFSVSWNSEIIGEGIEELTEIKNEKLLRSKITFVKPYPAVADGEFLLEEKDGKTKITWSFSSELPVIMSFAKSKIEKMLLEDFRRGLLMLKEFVEKGVLETSSKVEGVDKVETFYYIGIHGKSSSYNLHEETAYKFNSLLEYCNEKSVICSTMMTIYKKVDLENDNFDFNCCLLVSEEEYDRLLADFSHDEIFMGRYDSSDTLKIIHTGSYHYLANSWMLGNMYVKSEKLLLNKKSSSIEIYKNRLEGLEDEKLVTEVHIPIID